MEYLILIAKAIGIEYKYVIAGLLGAVVRTILSGKKFTWAIFLSTIAGMFCAIYLTPVVIIWFGLLTADVAVHNGIAFVIGLTGLSIAEAVLKLVHQFATNPKVSNNFLKLVLEYLTRDGNDKKNPKDDE